MVHRFSIWVMFFLDVTIWWIPKIGVHPQSSILMEFSLINHSFWGTPMDGNPIYTASCNYASRFISLCRLSPAPDFDITTEWHQAPAPAQTTTNDFQRSEVNLAKPSIHLHFRLSANGGSPVSMVSSCLWWTSWRPLPYLPWELLHRRAALGWRLHQPRGYPQMVGL